MRWHVSDFGVVRSPSVHYKGSTTDLVAQKRVLWFLTGTSAGCNQYAGELPDERLGRAYVFLNKSCKGSSLARQRKFGANLYCASDAVHQPTLST